MPVQGPGASEHISEGCSFHGRLHGHLAGFTAYGRQLSFFVCGETAGPCSILASLGFRLLPCEGGEPGVWLCLECILAIESDSARASGTCGVSVLFMAALLVW